MNYLYTIILGALRGLGGCLPISESGHLALVGTFLEIPAQVAENGGLDSIFHLALLAAVILAFPGTVLKMFTGFFSMIGGVFTGKFKWKKASRYQIMAVYVLLAAVPTVVVYFILQSLALNPHLILVGAMLLINAGLLFIGSHSLCQDWTMLDMKPSHSLKLGLFQGAAGFLPGLSRGGTTLTMCINMGFKPAEALEFSFMMSLPAILLNAIPGLFELKALALLPVGAIIAGGAAALILGYLSIRLMKWIIGNDRLGIFMFYSAVAGIAAIILNFV